MKMFFVFAFMYSSSKIFGHNSCRDSSHDTIIRDIMCHYRIRPYYHVIPNLDFSKDFASSK